MGKRLNDTASLVAEGPVGSQRHTVSCRKIENGYLTQVETSNPGTGKYECREVFSKEAPKIQPPKVSAQRGREALGEAVSYLKSEPSGAGSGRL